MVKSGARIPDGKHNYKRKLMFFSFCSTELIFLYPIAEATAVVQISDTKRIMNYDGTEESIQIMIKPENGQNIKYEKFNIFYIFLPDINFIFFLSLECLYLYILKKRW